MVLVYQGSKQGQGITIYHDGVQVGEDTNKSFRNADTLAPGDVRMGIGRYYTDRDGWYSSVEVDELTFWNSTISSNEVQLISN